MCRKFWILNLNEKKDRVKMVNPGTCQPLRLNWSPQLWNLPLNETYVPCDHLLTGDLNLFVTIASTKRYFKLTWSMKVNGLTGHARSDYCDSIFIHVDCSIITFRGIRENVYVRVSSYFSAINFENGCH